MRRAVPGRGVRRGLLDLDGRACLLELLLELVGLFAVDALLDRLGSLVHERLGLFETEARRGAHDLDDLDLLVAGAREHHVDGARHLLLRASVAAAAGGSGRGCSHRGRGDAELLLERLDALGELEHGDALELLDPVLCAGCHVQSSLVGFVSASAETSAWLSSLAGSSCSGSACVSACASAAGASSASGAASGSGASGAASASGACGAAAA